MKECIGDYKVTANYLLLKRIAKLGVFVAVGMILGVVTMSKSVSASEWVATSPTEIHIVSGSNSYTMKKGDTLWAIATKVNTDVVTLALENNIELSTGEESYLQIGTVIRLVNIKSKALTPSACLNGEVESNDDNQTIKERSVVSNVPKNNVHESVVLYDSSSSSDSIDDSNHSVIVPPINEDLDKYSESPKAIKPYIPSHEDKYITIDVDIDGNTLSLTENYIFISETTVSITETSISGDTVTTHTTTRIWRPDVPEEIIPELPDIV